MHVWAYRANRTINKQNKKKHVDRRDNLQEEETWQKAPVGTTGNVMLELVILKRYYEHPYLKVNTRKRGTEDESNSEGSASLKIGSSNALRMRRIARGISQTNHPRTSLMFKRQQPTDR